jgi:hypothetical protein
LNSNQTEFTIFSLRWFEKNFTSKNNLSNQLIISHSENNKMKTEKKKGLKTKVGHFIKIIQEIYSLTADLKVCLFEIIWEK